MKKNHLDFKDLAQSLAMDKGKLERYVTVSFLLKLSNNSESCLFELYILHIHEIGPNQKKKSLSHVIGIIEKELFWDIRILQKLLYLSNKLYAFIILMWICVDEYFCLR